MANVPRMFAIFSPGRACKNCKNVFCESRARTTPPEKLFLHLRLLPKRSLFTDIKDLSGQLCL